MPIASNLSEVLETTEPERLATGFHFYGRAAVAPGRLLVFRRSSPQSAIAPYARQGAGAHQDHDRRQRHDLRPARPPDRLRRRRPAPDQDGPGWQSRVACRQLQRRRFNRPNDVICHSNGCLYFTDPDKRRPYHEREIPGPAGKDNLWDDARVYRLAPDGSLSVLANCEYPNGLALSPDERTMYVANTRSSQYIHAIRLDAAGHMVGRTIFADLNEGSEPGIPDGLKVDSIGRVYCTGPGGIWVMASDGRRVGVIRWPEQAVNFAFGGPDLRTLFCCAHTSVYTLRVKVPGNPPPWYKRRGQ